MNLKFGALSSGGALSMSRVLCNWESDKSRPIITIRDWVSVLGQSSSSTGGSKISWTPWKTKGFPTPSINTTPFTLKISLPLIAMSVSSHKSKVVSLIGLSKTIEADPIQLSWLEVGIESFCAGAKPEIFSSGSSLGASPKVHFTTSGFVDFG